VKGFFNTFWLGGSDNDICFGCLEDVLGDAQSNAGSTADDDNCLILELIDHSLDTLVSSNLGEKVVDCMIVHPA